MADAMTLRDENDALRRDIAQLKADLANKQSFFVSTVPPQPRGGPEDLKAQPGDVLSVTGLVKRTELNGKLAHLQYYDTHSGRWSVLVENTRMQLKGTNLQHTPRGLTTAFRAPKPRHTARAAPTARPASAQAAAAASGDAKPAAGGGRKPIAGSSSSSKAANQRPPPKARTAITGTKQRIAPLEKTARDALAKAIANPRRHEEVLC